MDMYMGTKFERDVGSMRPGCIRKTLLKKSVNDWYNEHLMRLQLACILMKEMEIGKRVYEFCDADVIDGKRIETFSDYLNNANNYVAIVSRNLEAGNFDGVDIIKSRNGAFGELSEYVTEKDVRRLLNGNNNVSSNLSYDVIDSIIFNGYHKRLENYLGAAISLGKDCYFPIIGYLDSPSLPKELSDGETLKRYASKINGCEVSEAEVTVTADNSFIKIIKMVKPNVR